MHRKSILIIPTHIGTKEDKTNNMAQNDIAEIKWNEYGYLAAQMVGQKDIDGARAMLKKAPLKTQDEHARKRLDIMYNVDEAVARVAGTEGRDYLFGVNTSPVSSFPLIYDRAVSRLNGPAQEGLMKFLNQYAGGKTIGQMKRTIGELEGIKKSEPGVHSDEEKQKAIDALKALEPYLDITSFLQNSHYKPVVRGAEDDRENDTSKGIEGLLTSGKF